MGTAARGDPRVLQGLWRDDLVNGSREDLDVVGAVLEYRRNQIQRFVSGVAFLELRKTLASEQARSRSRYPTSFKSSNSRVTESLSLFETSCSWTMYLIFGSGAAGFCRLGRALAPPERVVRRPGVSFTSTSSSSSSMLRLDRASRASSSVTTVLLKLLRKSSKAAGVNGQQEPIGEIQDEQHTLLIVVVDIQLHGRKLGHGCRFRGGIVWVVVFLGGYVYSGAIEGYS